MSKRSFIVKAIAIIIPLFFAINIIRTNINGLKPDNYMTLEGLLNIASEASTPFAHTYSTIIKIGESFNLTGSAWEAVLGALKALYNLITIPFQMLFDVFEGLWDVLDIFTKLTGYVWT